MIRFSLYGCDMSRFCVFMVKRLRICVCATVIIGMNACLILLLLFDNLISAKDHFLVRINRFLHLSLFSVSFFRLNHHFAFLLTSHINSATCPMQLIFAFLTLMCCSNTICLLKVCNLNIFSPDLKTLH